MFVVLLRFARHKDQAGRLMEDHKKWIKRGFDDEVFLLVGSLQPNLAARSSRTTPRWTISRAGRTTIPSSRKASSAWKFSRSLRRTPTSA